MSPKQNWSCLTYYNPASFFKPRGTTNFRLSWNPQNLYNWKFKTCGSEVIQAAQTSLDGIDLNWLEIKWNILVLVKMRLSSKSSNKPNCFCAAKNLKNDDVIIFFPVTKERDVCMEKEVISAPVFLSYSLFLSRSFSFSSFLSFFCSLSHCYLSLSQYPSLSLSQYPSISLSLAFSHSLSLSLALSHSLTLSLALSFSFSLSMLQYLFLCISFIWTFRVSCFCYPSNF